MTEEEIIVIKRKGDGNVIVEIKKDMTYLEKMALCTMLKISMKDFLRKEDTSCGMCEHYFGGACTYCADTKVVQSDNKACENFRWPWRDE